jgi:hypothetical protein
LFDWQMFTAALAAAGIAQSHPELIGVDSHLLAAGRRP